MPNWNISPCNLAEAIIAGAELMAEDMDAAPANHEVSRANVEKVKKMLRETARELGDEDWEAGMDAVLSASEQLRRMVDLYEGAEDDGLSVN